MTDVLEDIEVVEQEQHEEQFRCQAIRHSRLIWQMSRRIEVFYGCTIEAVAIVNVGCAPDQPPLYVCRALASTLEGGMARGEGCAQCRQPVAECWSLTWL